jgi:hypothetical protein
VTRLVGPFPVAGRLLGTPGFAYSDFDKEGPSSGAGAEASSIMVGRLERFRISAGGRVRRIPRHLQ